MPNNHRATFPGTINPLDPVDASDNNTLPGGACGRSTTVSNSGSIGATAVAIVGCPNVALLASRLISVHVHVPLIETLTGTGQANIKGRILIQRPADVDYVNFVTYCDETLNYDWSPNHRISAAGLYFFNSGAGGTFQFRADLAASSGHTIQSYCSDDASPPADPGPALLLVRDEGPWF